MTTQTLLTEWLETYQKEHIKSRTYSRFYVFALLSSNDSI